MNVLETTNRFLATTDGNWGTASNWSYGRIPIANDNVSIEANCTSINVAPATLSQLVVLSGCSLVFGTTVRSLAVNGNFNCQGTIDMNSAAHTLILTGVYNDCVNLITDINESTVQYNRAVTNSWQQLFGSVNYRNILCSGTNKKATGVIVCNNFTTNVNAYGGAPAHTLVSMFDFTVNGIYTGNTFGSGTSFVFRGDSVVTFNGNVTLNEYAGLDFRNKQLNINCSTLTGTSGASFVLNLTSQTTFINSDFTLSHVGNAAISIQLSNVLIASGKTFVLSVGNNCKTNIYKIEGQAASSKFVNKSYVQWPGTNLPMNTGILDITTFANTWAYYQNGGGTFFIKPTNYWTLVLDGKAASSTNYIIQQNTICYGNLISNTANTGTTISLGVYDLTVYGSTTLGEGDSMVKSGSGKILFIGLVDLWNTGGMLNFYGNPDVEFRGGLLSNRGSHLSPLVMGTGIISFTTNSQTITISQRTETITNLLVGGNITVTKQGSASLIVTNLSGIGGSPVFNGSSTTTLANNLGGITYNG